jgi:hypothetical protein
MGQPFRFDPQGPVQAYKTYQVKAPRATHFRPATCKEVDCAAYRNGWVTNVDTNTAIGRQQANYIRLHSGRTWAVSEVNNLASFAFPPGQECFREHSVPLEREPLYVVRGGDWRANLGMIRQHVRPADWVDDFATHQQSIADTVERG